MAKKSTRKKNTKSASSTPLKERQFVEIVWRDANSVDGWAEAHTMKPAPLIITRGWLVKEDKHAYHLAASVADDVDDFEIAMGMTIPKSMKVKKRVLKV